MISKKKVENGPIEIVELKITTLTFYMVGTAPLVMHRLSEKAKKQLLLPQEKTTADKKTKLKHDPLIEFRESIYQDRQGIGPTRILFPSRAILLAIGDVCKDIPDTSATQILRLTRATTSMVPIYGIPQVHIRPVRLSDMNHTMDIRTRAGFAEWATSITIQFSHSHLPQRSLVRLVGYAGMLRGLGEDRPGKAKGGEYGTFMLVDENNKDYQRLVRNCSKAAQDKAMENPACFDADSEELFVWAQENIAQRREQLDDLNPATVVNSRRNGKKTALI